MQRHRRGSNSLMGLTLFGAILMVTPGNQVARADSERPGPTCSSAQLQQGQDPSLERFLSGIRRQAEVQRTSQERDPNGWVVLNNRGYNYAPANQPISRGAAPAPAAAPNTRE